MVRGLVAEQAFCESELLISVPFSCMLRDDAVPEAFQVGKNLFELFLFNYFGLLISFYGMQRVLPGIFLLRLILQALSENIPNKKGKQVTGTSI